jgi:hypothetical protein
MSDNGVDGVNDTSGTTVTGDQVESREIVVEVDGSPADSAALVAAAELWRSTGAPLCIVYTWQLTAQPAGATSSSFWVASATDARARATRWVLDALGASAATVRWNLQVVEGPPGVMEAATEPDNVFELSS